MQQQFTFRRSIILFVFLLFIFFSANNVHAKKYYESRLLSKADIKYINYLLNVTTPVSMGKYMEGCKMYEDPYDVPVYTLDDSVRIRTVPVLGCDNVTYPSSVGFYGDILIDSNFRDICSEKYFAKVPHCVNQCLGAEGYKKTFTRSESIYCSVCHNRWNETDNFLDFHHLVRDGNCTVTKNAGLYLPYMQGCSGIANGVNLHGVASVKIENNFGYRVCYCHKENVYARDGCDRLEINGLRRLNDATKYIIFIICIALLAISVPLVLAPQVFKLILKFKNTNELMGASVKNLMAFFDLRVLSIIYMNVGIVLLAIENICEVSPAGYLTVPLRPIVQFLQLFSICHIMMLWIYMLYVAQENKTEWPLLLKVLFALFYVLMVVLLVILYIIIIVVLKTPRINDPRAANMVCLYLAFLLTVGFCIGLLVYAMRMYQMLSQAQKIAFLNLKFNRYMVTVLILSAITIIVACIAIGFDYTDRRFLGSSKVYYDIRFFFLDLALLAALYSLVGLVFDFDAIKHLYCCKPPSPM
jgi:hypothetical protein